MKRKIYDGNLIDTNDVYAVVKGNNGEYVVAYTSDSHKQPVEVVLSEEAVNQLITDVMSRT